MKRRCILAILLIGIMSGNYLCASLPSPPEKVNPKPLNRDTLSSNQALYNGRIWRNLYYMINGNQFLFTNEFIKGSVSLKGQNFSDVNIKYDIFKDELLTPIDHGRILQMNKELVDSFSFSFQNRIYNFVRLTLDSTNKAGEYYCVVHNGKSSLYLKYSKKINKLSISGESDSFYQNEKLFLVRNNKIIPISGKSDLLRAMNDKRDQIKAYIRKNKISVSEAEPESIVPVIIYYDRLSQ
jgi:hypothetical protein